jgi:hypothetical protein
MNDAHPIEGPWLTEFGSAGLIVEAKRCVSTHRISGSARGVSMAPHKRGYTGTVSASYSYSQSYRCFTFSGRNSRCT